MFGYDLMFSKDIIVYFVKRSWLLCLLELIKFGLLWCFFFMKLIEEDVVINVFKLVFENDIGVCNIDLGKKKVENFCFGFFCNNEIFLLFLYELIEIEWECLFVRVDYSESLVREFVCWGCIIEENFFIDFCIDSEDFLFVFFGVEGCVEC